MPGIARALSKLGFCSRRTGEMLASSGRVRVNGVVRRDPEYPVVLGRDLLSVDDQVLTPATPMYVMLNKPRGLVTTRMDEKGRDTIFTCLPEFEGQHLSAVGRLDKASEGLLLLTNDTGWAESILNPESGLGKTYHVQVRGVMDAELFKRLRSGVVDGGEHLRAVEVRCLRAGEKNTWLEIILDEGRNRQIRRMLEQVDLPVLRLVRVAIGSLGLGDLAKGSWRHLTTEERRALSNS